MNKKLVLLVVGLVSSITAFAPPVAQPPWKSYGTDILHLFLRKDMGNEGLLTNAIGSVKLGQNKQGNANNQRLDIAAANLETNATYQLWAALGDDTNFTYAANFQTDGKGRGLVRFMKVGSSNGKGVGKGKMPLPAVLNPISNIRTLVIANVNTQAVLTAELRDPEKLQYLVKRSWAEADAAAALRLHATTKMIQFRLLATRLATNANYFLALNGEPVDTATSTADGKLSFKTLPVDSSDILHIRTLAIWDSNSNSVLSTTLP